MDPSQRKGRLGGTSIAPLFGLMGSIVRLYDEARGNPVEPFDEKTRRRLDRG